MLTSDTLKTENSSDHGGTKTSENREIFKMKTSDNLLYSFQSTTRISTQHSKPRILGPLDLLLVFDYNYPDGQIGLPPPPTKISQGLV